MANYLANGTTWRPDKPDALSDGEKKPPRRVRAFVDLHSYGQLCEASGRRWVMIKLIEAVMFPFAHSCDDFPPDAEMLMEAGLGVAKAMRRQQGEGYQAGQACDLTYRYVRFRCLLCTAQSTCRRAPGDAIDFSYGVTDVQWSYSAELRDTGTVSFRSLHISYPRAEDGQYGFLLPPNLIRPTGEEVTAGLLYLAKFIYDVEIAG